MIKKISLFLFFFLFINFAFLKPLFTETFDDPKLEGWEYTEDPKYQGKFDVKLPQFPFTIENDYGLTVMNNSQFYGISRPFSKPLDFSENGIIFHYTVRWQFPLNCGGAYVKFFREPKSGLFDPKKVNGLTPYSLMFGPDRCGAKSVVHFRISTERKAEETQESKNYEKYLKKTASVPLNLIAHSYMLRIYQGKYELKVDNEIRSEGLLSDLELFEIEGFNSEKAKEEDSEIDEEKQKLQEQLIKEITSIKEKVSAIGLELWSVDAGILVDDIWIGHGNQKKEYDAFYKKQVEPKITAHKNAHNQALNQNEGLDLFGGGDDKKKTPVKQENNEKNEENVNETDQIQTNFMKIVDFVIKYKIELTTGYIVLFSILITILFFQNKTIKKQNKTLLDLKTKKEKMDKDGNKDLKENEEEDEKDDDDDDDGDDNGDEDDEDDEDDEKDDDDGEEED